MTADSSEQVIQASRERAVTEEVVASFKDSASPRFAEVMSSLVRHLHAFARDVRLTEDEWNLAIEFLTDTGKICSGNRQEFILLSDVLGLSMMTVGINSPPRVDATESTVFGPFFVHDSPHAELGGDISGGLAGNPCYVRGKVLDIEGAPIPGARVEIWGADDDGFYDVQYDGGALKGRAHLFTDADGAYDFWTVQPAAYPIPDDGPVGRLLTVARRSPMRPAHIHYMVTAPGFRTLITHIFVSGGDHLASDAVFGVKESLVVEFQTRQPGDAPRGRRVSSEWAEVEFDIVLAPVESPALS